MAEFFKLLGGTDPVTQSLGVMTQGIGFPLRDVEPSTEGGPVSVQFETALSASSTGDQLPTGLGVPLLVNFGAAQTTDYFDLAADGTMTVLQTDSYQLRGKFSVGRRGGSGGLAQIYLRLLLNGTQIGNSSHVIVASPDVEIPFDFEGVGNLTAGDTLQFQIIRDTDGVNQGGLYAGVPDVAWNESPCARLLITRVLAVES